MRASRATAEKRKTSIRLVMIAVRVVHQLSLGVAFGRCPGEEPPLGEKLACRWKGGGAQHGGPWGRQTRCLARADSGQAGANSSHAKTVGYLLRRLIRVT